MDPFVSGALRVPAFLTVPSNAALALTVLGILLTLRRRRLGTALALIGGIALALGGLTPLPVWLGAPLENRFPAPQALGAFTGIVVLGGAVSTPLSFERGQLVLHDAAGRVVALADLARRYPQARLAYSGSGDNVALHRFGSALGLDTTRITYESRSRNTHENAVFSAALLEPQPGERWLLVTSAWHMPRAVGSFRAAGFEVVPYPTDYRTGNEAFSYWAIGAGLANFDRVLKEWIGLAVYRLRGYTNTLFPAP